MRKNFYIMIGLCIVALISCSKDGNMPCVDNNVRFIGVIESYESRTIMTNDYFNNDHYRIQWETGTDKVGIYCDEPNVKDKKSGIYKVSSVNDGGAAVFELDGQALSSMKSKDGFNYAVYPSDATFNNGTFSYDISPTYTYTDIPSLIKKSLMVAKVKAPDDGESTVELNFTKAQSILRLCFNAYDPSKYSGRRIKTVVLESKEKYLNGRAQVSWDDDTFPSAIISSGTADNKKLTITLRDAQELTHYLNDNYHVEVYLPIVPTTFEENELIITLLDENGNQMYKKEVGSRLIIERGTIQGLKHTLDMPEVSKPDGATDVTNMIEFEQAISNGQYNLYLKDGTYTIGGSYNYKFNEINSLIITGSKNVVIKYPERANHVFTDSEIAFNGITFDCRDLENKNVGYNGSNLKSATFNDCNFFGQYTCYAGDYYFNNCYIDGNNEGFWVYGANSMTFKNCVFYSGDSRAVHLYKDGISYETIVNIHNCHFFAERPYWDQWAGKTYVSVVEIKSETSNSEVHFTGNNTKSETYKGGWYRKYKIDENSNINCKVTFNGVEDTN